MTNTAGALHTVPRRAQDANLLPHYNIVVVPACLYFILVEVSVYYFLLPVLYTLTTTVATKARPQRQIQYEHKSWYLVSATMFRS